MSATNRGAIRNHQDFYSTPENAFSVLLPFLPMDVEFWEPAQGDGRIVDWLTRSGRRANGADLSTGTDYLTDFTPRQFVITNPPFSLVLAKDGTGFLPHALKHSKEVMFLLRLNFLGAKYRKEFFQQHEPAALFVLSDRPKFHGSAGSDACDYAWFYWGKRFTGITHP